MEPALFFLAMFGTIFGIFYMHISTRHKERMAIMDKDIDPNLVWGYKNNSKSTKNRLAIYLLVFLKIGMILIGVGVGLLVASYLIYALDMNQKVAAGSSITISIGISLIIFYFIGKRAEKKLEDK